MGLLLWFIAMGLYPPPDTHGAVEEKATPQAARGGDPRARCLDFERNERAAVPQELAPTLKEIPAEAREKINLAALEHWSEEHSTSLSPGCLFGNPVTGSIARAFLGDEAHIKVGVYRYQNGDYSRAIDAFSRVHQDYPQRAPTAGRPLLGGESYYRLGQLTSAANGLSTGHPAVPR